MFLYIKLKSKTLIFHIGALFKSWMLHFFNLDLSSYTWEGCKIQVFIIHGWEKTVQFLTSVKVSPSCCGRSGMELVQGTSLFLCSPLSLFLSDTNIHAHILKTTNKLKARELQQAHHGCRNPSTRTTFCLYSRQLGQVEQPGLKWAITGDVGISGGCLTG